MTTGNSKILSAIVTLSICLCFTLPILSASPTDTTSLGKGSPRVELRAPKEEREQVTAPEAAVKRGISRARKKSALRRPDVIYYATPDETVTEMLALANIRQGDVLYDLGSGDGRIPIKAAQLYGIHEVGIEIDPAMVAVAQERAQKASVASLVSFINADLFRTNITAASVVTLYLSNKLNLLLRPKLLHELRPGTRILSHDFHMGDWAPERKIKVPWQRNLYRTIYLWTVPEHGKQQERTGRKIHQLRKL